MIKTFIVKNRTLNKEVYTGIKQMKRGIHSKFDLEGRMLITVVVKLIVAKID